MEEPRRVVRLVEREPRLDPGALVERFVPPLRFAGARFSTYVPAPDHPSQAGALASMTAFAESLVPPPPPPRTRWLRRRPSALAGAPARYLDGGFGVGKTHLLASLWHAAPGPKAYVTFAELAAFVGVVGMERSIDAVHGLRLLCIDEFELDDVANTLLTVTFLRAVVGAGTKVAATSNTLPDRLGEGRFAADDFRREIAAIADHFEVVRIDGPDYRARDRVEAQPLDADELDRWVARQGGIVARDRFPALVTHLRRVPPVQVGALLDGVESVAIDDLLPITNQGDALLVVHLVDELYDAAIPVAASGCPVEELFAGPWRSGGYRKKYGRCESRLAALFGEAARSAT